MAYQQKCICGTWVNGRPDSWDKHIVSKKHLNFKKSQKAS